MTYECGCENEIHEPSGILHSIKKCDFHLKAQTIPESRDLAYYKALGSIDGAGIPQNQHYFHELKAGLDEDDFEYLRHCPDKEFLELGAGLGMYVPLILAGGASYVAVENSPFACDWIIKTFYVPVVEDDVETYEPVDWFDCVIAAHIVEHVDDAPALLQKIYNMTRERVYLIVPDDRDPVNPDHRWFFTVETLHALLKRIGFRKVRSNVRDCVAHESFIYCVAEK